MIMICNSNCFSNCRVYIVAVLILGCSYPPWQHHYEGDGYFIDYGTREPNTRYVLKLGSINSGSPNSVRFKIGHLPKEQFRLGFTGPNLIYDISRLDRKAQAGDPDVRVTMRDLSRDSIVFVATGKIGTWAWGHKVGDQGSTFVHKGNTGETEPFDGTHFVAKHGAEYEVIVEIIQPSIPEMELGIELRGGGWY